MKKKDEIFIAADENTKNLLNDSFFVTLANNEEKNTKEFENIMVLIDNYTKLKQKNILKTLVNLILDKKINLNFDDIKYNESKKMYEVQYI